MTGTPELEAQCQRQVQQRDANFERTRANSYQDWQQRQAACQAAERAEKDRREAAQKAAAQDAQREREKAERDRLIAQDRARQAAAEKERLQAEAEKAKIQLDLARAQADIAKVSQGSTHLSSLAVSPGWALGIVLLSLLAFFKTLGHQDEIPRGLRILIGIAVPLATSLIGMWTGFSKDLTLGEVTLLELPAVGSLVASLTWKYYAYA